MHLSLLRTALAIGSCLGLSSPGFAQDAPGDVSSGRRIAEAWCAACHQIGAGEPEPKSGAPSFVSIARMPSTTTLALNVFLRSTHKVMPDFQLTREEADDVVA
ncbi:MAG TPA: c-type cytochrome, partial [Methylocella sp.]|nr:c-type cytochrome [Methylocella sp.]